MIRTSEKTDELYPAMFAARNEMPEVNKSADMSGSVGVYKYSTFRDYLRAVSPAMKGHKLSVAFSVVSTVESHLANVAKKEYRVTIVVAARLFHTSGQWIEVQGTGDGYDTLDKAAGKAATYAKKNTMGLLFGLSANEDADTQLSPLEEGEVIAQTKGATPEDMIDTYGAKMAAAVDLGSLAVVGQEIRSNPAIVTGTDLHKTLGKIYTLRKNDIEKQGATDAN